MSIVRGRPSATIASMRATVRLVEVAGERRRDLHAVEARVDRRPLRRRGDREHMPHAEVGQERVHAVAVDELVLRQGDVAVRGGAQAARTSRAGPAAAPPVPSAATPARCCARSPRHSGGARTRAPDPAPPGSRTRTAACRSAGSCTGDRAPCPATAAAGRTRRGRSSDDEVADERVQLRFLALPADLACSLPRVCAQPL